MQPRADHSHKTIDHPGPLRKQPARNSNHISVAEREAGEAFILHGAIPAGPARERFGDLRDEGARIEDLVPGIRPGDYFLVVDGDSMRDAGLLHGQHVVIRPGIVPRNGDICAVWVDGLGNTLKKVYCSDETVTLVPANPHYQPVELPADQVRIQGVLVAALAVRSFRGG